MTFMKSTLIVLLCIINSPIIAEEISGKFAPPAGQVLVFAGQDNISVGGTQKYSDGYVDSIGVPGGITHYVYFSEGWTNGFGRTFPLGSVAGLNSEVEWAAGPMCQKAYLESPQLKDCVMHVSISMEGGGEVKVANGMFDHLIEEFVQFIADHPDRVFFIRIGYEFDGNWNKYQPESFKKAFRRIVDSLRTRNLSNYATVFASSSTVKPGQFEEYDPGSEYYDWIGYSWWGNEKKFGDAAPALAYARKLKKPVFVAESTARGHYFDKEDPEELWSGWFKEFFQHIEDNKDVIRAVSYINADWDGQDMWDGWGQTRIETSPRLKQRWQTKMAESTFINAADNPLQVIGFFPPTTRPQSSNVGQPAYQNASLPDADRVADLLSRMTIEEKVAQITGWWFHDERKLQREGSVFKPEFYAKKCPHGIGELGPLHNLSIDEDVQHYAAIQEYFRNQTRLGIPAILHDEAAHGFMKFQANSFPAPIGLACSWNTSLLEDIYSCAAQEARSRGVSHVLSPVVDVARELRWGRVDETLGEDPFLVGHLGAAMVRGLQGSSDGQIATDHVAATLKHFVGYAGTLGGRNRSPYPNGMRHLLDTEIPPFRHVIKTAHPASVMAAFNEVDGLPCHINPWLLQTVLRDRLGFKGLLVGDYQGLNLVRWYQKIGASDADVGKMALESGLQLELPNAFGYKHLVDLVKTGKVNETLIDTAVREMLSLKFRLGLFEAPMVLDAAKAAKLAASTETNSLATEAARQSIVLLKNEDNLLPLKLGTHKNIAVIGPNAAVCRLGNYSGMPQKTVSLFEGIRDYVGNQATVTHAEGCQIASNDTGSSYKNWRYVDEVQYASLEDNQMLIEAAVELAEHSDLVVLALGENVLLSREAWGANHIGDRTTFELTTSQQELAARVLNTGKPVVLVLNNGKPVVLGDDASRIPAILTAHYAGQQTGTALAEILFGETNPSGKLTISWPRTVGHIPSHYSQHGSSLVFDYLDSPQSPQYPFGHGLSYTSFEYTNISISAETIQAGQTVDVTFTLTNTGQREGTEISQLYVSGEEFEIARPALELKGFARTTLRGGESTQITVALQADDLFFHDMQLKRVLPNGKYLVRVGRSSADLSKPLTLGTISSAKNMPVASKTITAAKPIAPPAEAPAKPTLEPVSSRNRKPNVLFIAIDDLRPELGCYGKHVISPNIDKLAASGVQFNRAYCQQAVCGASRLSLMGGLYPTNTREQTFHVNGWRERHPNLLTMNQHFGMHGYQTIGMGKIYHGHSSGPATDLENWDTWIDVSTSEYALQKNKDLVTQALKDKTKGSTHAPPEGPMTELADVPDDTYIDGKRAARAINVLDQLANDGEKPFFLAVGFTKPHLPFVAPKKYWDLYDRDSFSMPSNSGRPPQWPEDAAFTKANEMQRYVDYVGNGPKDFPQSLNKRLLHGYAAAASFVDANVGRVLDALEEKGLADNTIVVLWGDHGWKLGDHSSWCKHTNFECDTRVPLIVRDPRMNSGQTTDRLVELIDLYPTLCDLTGIETPAHCQGRSFRGLLDDPESGHRYSSYSSYPAWKSLGHSVRFKTFRYTEWFHNDTGTLRARVLTDLRKDPGEVTNCAEDPAYTESLAAAKTELHKRIKEADANTVFKNTSATQATSTTIQIETGVSRRRQAIDGFGGSVAFWATKADNKALTATLNELNANIIRVQGEVTKAGLTDHNVALLQRGMAVNPSLQVLLTFWQPRSAEHLEPEYWLRAEQIDGTEQYILRDDRMEQWADELISRVQFYRSLGVNVTTVGIQNESNWSHEGTQTCRWEPDRLKTFIEQFIQPRLEANHLTDLLIAAPDLAYIGPDASEFRRFLPALMSPDVDIAAYHMYDSYQKNEDGNFEILVGNTQKLAQLADEFIPTKKLWMTETTGAQWNGNDWHTYGWTADLTEHQKAIQAARYMHTTFVDAQASAFLWWGLIYSLAPGNEQDANVRQKHRDEGLVLVCAPADQVGEHQTFVERTKKFYVFSQYSKFIHPGYKRVDLDAVSGVYASAYVGEDDNRLIAVVINDSETSKDVSIQVDAGYEFVSAHQTDKSRNCEQIGNSAVLPPQSVRTVVFQK